VIHEETRITVVLGHLIAIRIFFSAAVQHRLASVERFLLRGLGVALGGAGR